MWGTIFKLYFHSLGCGLCIVGGIEVYKLHHPYIAAFMFAAAAWNLVNLQRWYLVRP